MDIRGHLNDDVIQLFIVTAATIVAILISIFSLTHGIFDVFPFFYILPIILIVYFYPRYGVLYSLGISLVYVGLVYFYGSSNTIQIAISTAWFAIFVAISVVASSYAVRLRDEEKKVRQVFENAQDGIFCFELHSMRLHEINPMCARMLKYEREDLLGRDISTIWAGETERAGFLSCIKDGEGPCEKEVMLRAKDGTLRRCLVSAILSTEHLVLCSAIDVTDEKVADDKIRRMLDDLEQQVREQTADLEKINGELKVEIQKRRQFESPILSKEEKNNKLEWHR